MKPLVALLLAFCLTAQAGPAEQAQQSAAADVVTTGVGLALGAAEANPLGLALIRLKAKSKELKSDATSSARGHNESRNY